MAPDTKETCCLVCQFSEMNLSVEIIYLIDPSEDEEEEDEPETEAGTDEEIEPGLPNCMNELSQIAQVDEQDTQKELSLQIPTNSNEQLASNFNDMEPRIHALDVRMENLKLACAELEKTILLISRIKQLLLALIETSDSLL